MITNKHDSTEAGSYKVLRGLSTDSKPTGVANGSEFLEMDTGKTYLFDEDGTTWAEQPASGGGVSVQALTVTANGTYTAPEDTAYSPVTVDIQTGGVAESDVNFYDYDGTVVASYTAADFANLTEMPANPDRTSEGLTAQGWNWSLADAKAYVASCGMLDIGQMYVTSDGKTRVYIHLEEGRLSPTLGLGVNGSVDVDWGDGTAHSTLTGTNATTKVETTHTYASDGDYVIALTVTGSANLLGTSLNSYLLYAPDNTKYAYLNAIRKVEIGDGVGIQSYAFCLCSVKHIMLGATLQGINNSAFEKCYSLTHITIPNGVSVVSQSSFTRCSALRTVVLPNATASIQNGVFTYCELLSRLTIPNRINNTPASIATYCHSLKNVTFPVETINTSGFYECYSLTHLVIPNSVTSIGATVFGACYSLGSIKFESTTPPTLGDSNTFGNLPTDCVIYVPSGTLSAYTSATNYPSSSTYTYVEY